jgi:hypothetical protein
MVMLIPFSKDLQAFEVLKHKQQQLERSTHGGLKHCQFAKLLFPILNIVVALMANFSLDFSSS